MLWAPSLGLVAVLAFCAGSGNSVYHPCGTALTAEKFVANRPYAISFHSMMGNLGASLIPMALAYIAGVGGWRLSVALCTLPLVVLLPLIALRFPAGNRRSLEGTRSDIGKVLAFQNGAFKLALQEKVAILPIAIKGTADAIPKGRWIFDSKANMSITILPAIETTPFQPIDFERLRDIARAMIEAA